MSDYDDYIPSFYKPSPQICSETLGKYRWPIAQTREVYLPWKPSVDPPSDSDLPKLSLRIHKQSSYTDAFKGHKPLEMQRFTPESSWRDPVGKRGNFYGISTYEKDYKWLERTAQMDTLPLVSTIGLGILPIVGNETHEVDKMQVDKVPDKSTVRQSKEGDTKEHKCLIKRKYAPEDIVPLQEIWGGESTHTTDFLIPPKGWKTEKAKVPEPELKFTGEIQTTTAAMIDYQDPKSKVCDVDLEKDLGHCESRTD